jgi:hypothetical protein
VAVNSDKDSHTYTHREREADRQIDKKREIRTIKKNIYIRK